jgi:hypothetical protein
MSDGHLSLANNLGSTFLLAHSSFNSLFILLIPIANICQRTLFAAGCTPDTNLLAVQEHGDVEVEEDTWLRRKQI